MGVAKLARKLAAKMACGGSGGSGMVGRAHPTHWRCAFGPGRGRPQAHGARWQYAGRGERKCIMRG